MSLQTPLFRYDLETSQFSSQGNRYVDVNCPESGHAFRFYEIEYAVACGMDGQRSKDQIVSWADEELGLRTDANEVQEIIDKLASLGYIKGVAATAQPSTAEVVDLGHAGATSPAAPATGAAVTDNVALGLAGGASSLGTNEASPAAESKASAVELGNAGTASSMGAEVPSSDINVDLGASGDAGLVEEPTQIFSDNAAKDPYTPVVPGNEETRVAAKSEIEFEDKSHLEGKGNQGQSGTDEVSVTESSLFEANSDDLEEGAAAPVQMVDESSVSKPLPIPDKAPAPVSKIETYEDKQSAPLGLWLGLMLAAGGLLYIYTNYLQPKEEPEIPTRPEVHKTPIATSLSTKSEVLPSTELPSTEKNDEATIKDAGKMTQPVFALVEGREAEIVAPITKWVAWQEKSGTLVEKGDVVMGYAGYRSLDYASKKVKERLEKASANMAKAKNNAQKVRFEKNVKRLTEVVEMKTTQLAEISILAPDSGIYERRYQNNRKVSEGDIIGKVATPSVWRGTYPENLGEPGTLKNLNSEELVRELSCTIISSDSVSSNVECLVPEDMDSTAVNPSITIIK